MIIIWKFVDYEVPTTMVGSWDSTTCGQYDGMNSVLYRSTVSSFIFFHFKLLSFAGKVLGFEHHLSLARNWIKKVRESNGRSNVKYTWSDICEKRMYEMQIIRSLFPYGLICGEHRHCLGLIRAVEHTSPEFFLFIFSHILSII